MSLLLIGFLTTTEQSVSAEKQTNSKIPTLSLATIKTTFEIPKVSDDKSILEVGQSSRDQRGEITLKAIQNESQNYKLDAIEFTIREAKILHFKPYYSLINFYHTYRHEEEFDFVKLFVEIKNTSNKPLKFAPVALLNTSSGETKTWEDDIYLEELNGEMEANGIKKGNLGFIVKKANFDSIEITTSDVFNNLDQKLTTAEKIKVEF